MIVMGAKIIQILKMSYTDFQINVIYLFQIFKWQDGGFQGKREIKQRQWETKATIKYKMDLNGRLDKLEERIVELYYVQKKRIAEWGIERNEYKTIRNNMSKRFPFQFWQVKTLEVFPLVVIKIKLWTNKNNQLPFLDRPKTKVAKANCHPEIWKREANSVIANIWLPRSEATGATKW